MTNYEYILAECKNAHYYKWTPTATEACVKKLKGLTRPELVRLFTSRWLGKKDELRQVIFAMLFHEQLDQRDAIIRDATIEELGEMLMEKDGNYVKLAREELKRRYKEENRNKQLQIIKYFLQGHTKQDMKWGAVRDKWQKLGFANPPSIFDSWRK